MTAMMLLFTGGSPATSATGHGAGAGATSFTPIAHSPQGNARSTLAGQTAKDQRVTGYFTPTAVTKKNGHLRMRGLISGVIHKGDGSTRTFSATRTFRVATIDAATPGAGVPPPARPSATSCTWCWGRST